MPAYNSNGLWLTDPATLAKEAGELLEEGGFTALKLRLGRDRLADDLEAIRQVRGAAGDDIKLMVDFNQGLTLGDAIHRCNAGHLIIPERPGIGISWNEEAVKHYAM